MSSRTILICDASKQRFKEVVAALAQSDILSDQMDDPSKVTDFVLHKKPEIILMNMFVGGKPSIPLIKEIVSRTLSKFQKRAI